MRNLITFFLILLPNFIFSQVNIINQSLIDSSLNIAYLGVDNAIELIGYKSTNKLSYSTSNGTITDLGQNRYILRLAKEGECIISFSYNEKKIVSKEFKVELFSDFVKKFGSKYDSVAKDGYTYFISYQNLINDPVFRITIPGCYYKEPWKIVSYHITLDSLSGGETISEFTVTGKKPTKEQIQIIKKYGPNTFMTIDEIKATGPDERIRKLTPMIFVIK